VRNGAHAATNFGTAATLDVKLDSTDYVREAYLKFPVTGYANATKATLFLVPTFNGTDTAVTYSVELVTNDAWTETGLTWNNKPTSTTLLGQFTGSSVSTFAPVTLDITNEVKAQAAADGTISLRVRSTNTGIAKWINFGSRENTTPSFRPQLVVRVP
jgi:hyaluronate lyase